MPPKGASKASAAVASAAKKATPGRGRGRGKKRDIEEEEEEEEEEEQVVAPKSAGRKKTPAKKPPSDDEEEEEEELDEEEEEELDEEEEGEEDEEDFDEDEEDEEDDEDEDPDKQKRTLFIKNLPSNTTEEDVRVLSPDILTIKLEAPKKPTDKIYAVVDFADEETTNKNIEMIKGKKVHGNEVLVDRIGTESIVTFVTPALTPSSDPLKLYVTGFGRKITIEQLKNMFPTAQDVTLPLNPKDNNRPIGYAFIHYTDEGVCRKAHDASQELTYQNRTLVVMYGKKTPPPGATPAPEPKRKAPASGNKRGPKSKKPKKEEEEEEEEEEENEDNGEEDD